VGVELVDEEREVRILVTGASGFIGSHVVTALLERGHTVVAAGRDATKARQHSWHDAVDFVALGIPGDTSDLFERSGRPDALLHAAWDRLDDYRAPMHFEQQLFDHYRFISSLVKQGLGQCLVLGTCLEYGLQQGALHEALPCKPILAYPLAKHLLHQLLQGLQFNTCFGLQWVRLFYTYGPGQRSSSLIAQLDAAIAARANVFDMSPGDQLRDYLPVQKLAGLLARIMEQRDFDGTVNCSSGVPVEVRALVEAHIREQGATIRPNPGRYGYPDHEPFAFWGDTTKLLELLERTA
jgi:nucleoside-diphosphate-sugar epimerase